MSTTCPTCGTPVPPDAPQGLCPRCLLRSSPATAAFGPFTPPSTAELAPLFPQLEVIELLGAGGMGAVYKARQPGLDRLVALKVLPHRDDPAFAERFTREARTLAKLSHPNIVTVYDFGRSGGLFYFVMEYVEGVNLREAERSGAMSPAAGLAVVPQICAALQFAHENGVVHRDIKPENILLDPKGRVKVADFGLAKLLGEAGPQPLTGTNQVMGTFHYMAPEQWEKPAAVDHRADIYSLGVVFYELLTGELPLGRFPLPSEKVQLDVRLDQVVLRTLEKQPERRYQHASDVKTDVERIGASADVAPHQPNQPTTGPANRSEAGRRLAAATAALFLVGLATCVIGLGSVGWSGVTLARIAAAPSEEKVTKTGGTTVTVRPTATRTGTAWIIALLVEQTLALGAGGVIVLGALSMRRPEHHGLSRAACVLAMFPLSPVWPAGLPVGIWALSVLRSPAARAAEPVVWHRPGGLAIASMAILLAGTLTAFLPWTALDMFGFPMTFYGFDRWYGVVAGGSCVAGLLALVSMELLHPSRAWRVAAPLAAGLIVVGVTAGYFAEMLRGPTVTTTQTQGDAGLQGLADAFAKQFVGGMQARPLFGPYVAAGVGLVLTSLGLLALRRPRVATGMTEMNGLSVEGKSNAKAVAPANAMGADQRPTAGRTAAGRASAASFLRRVVLPLFVLYVAWVPFLVFWPSAGLEALGVYTLTLTAPALASWWFAYRQTHWFWRVAVAGFAAFAGYAIVGITADTVPSMVRSYSRQERQRQLIGTWDKEAGGRMVFRTDGTFDETFRERVPDVGPNEPIDPEKTKWVDREGQLTGQFLWHADGIRIVMKAPGKDERLLKPVIDGDALTLLEADGRVWRLGRVR